MRNLTKLMAAALALCMSSAHAVTNTWTGGAGDTNWFTAGNWDVDVPSNGVDVVITNGSVLLTNETAELNSLTITNATLTFSNWTTRLRATNVWINNGATMTLPLAYTNNVMSNRVWIVCSNISIAAGGSINVNGKGYDGGRDKPLPGSGQGGGTAGLAGGAGSYGGRGGSYYGASGQTYGQPDAPLAPGSGGGGSTDSAGGPGAAGGGAVRIDATGGAVQVDGTISAVGASPTTSYAGSGSGGGIYINCKTLTGNGSLNASGGPPTSNNGGGGGRIAVIYDTAAQAQTNVPTGVFSTAGAIRGRSDMSDGDVGTLYFPDNAFLRETFVHSGHWLVPSFSSWSPTNLLVSNGWLRLTQSGFQLTVSNSITVRGGNSTTNRLELNSDLVTCGGALYIGPNAALRITNGAGTRSVVTCGGNLTVTNGGILYVSAMPTNASVPDYGGLVAVTGDVNIANNSAIYSLSSYMTNGGAHLFRMSNLVIAAGGLLSANGQGYAGGVSPTHTTGYGLGGGGPGTLGGGGGYGGRGGYSTDYVAVPGMTNGQSAPPLTPGSGGGYSSDSNGGPGGKGGGLLLIEATNAVTLNGTLSANGGAGGYFSGTGSGGGVYLQCKTITGSGKLSVDGVTAQCPSGGGRLAVIYDAVAQAATNKPTGVFSAAGGVGVGGYAAVSADMGSIYFPDAQFFGAPMCLTGQWFCASSTGWTVNSLLFTNRSWIRLPQAGLQLSVSGDVVITGTSKLDIGPNAYQGSSAYYSLYNNSATASVLAVGGNLILTNSSTLSLYGSHTNASTPNYGLLANVIGDVSIATNSTLYTISQITNGGSPLIRARHLTVNAGGYMNADSYGFIYSKGPGAGGAAGGGGYGGQGGGAAGGGTYGSSNAPVHAGSGGGSTSVAGAGGGVIRVEATGTLRVNGTVSAKGANATSGNSGGGAGGGIYLTCVTFDGAAGGLLRANGGSGAGTGGGGGGGRIAVWRRSDLDAYQGSFSVTNGGTNGAIGTIVMGNMPGIGTIFIVR